MAVNISEEVIKGFKNISGFKCKNRWMICHLEGATLNVEKMGGPEDTFDDFVNGFAPTEPRLAVFLLKFQSEDGKNCSKTCFVVFSPDTCNEMAKKFAIANAKQFMKDKCAPINHEFQINDMCDLTEAKFIEEFN
jgi:hypothetical protein